MPELQFIAALKRIVAAPPHDGHQAWFAAQIGISGPILNRILLGRRRATPEIVGTICAGLPKDVAAALMTAYLGDLAAEILATGPQRSAKVSVQMRQQRR